MINLRKTLFAATLAASFACAAPHAVAAPVVIDFEGVATPGEQTAVGNNYAENGFNFFNPGAPNDAAIIGQVSQNTSGSDYYTWNSPAANNPVTLTALVGSGFSLLSLDVGSKSGFSFANFDIIGDYVGGGSITFNVLGASNFTNVALTGFSDLSNVKFAFVSGDYGAIDNLVTSVPEPMSVTLVGLGLLGLALARRRAAEHGVNPLHR
jgi:hypothetical protein